MAPAPLSKSLAQRSATGELQWQIPLMAIQIDAQLVEGTVALSRVRLEAFPHDRRDVARHIPILKSHVPNRSLSFLKGPLQAIGDAFTAVAENGGLAGLADAMITRPKSGKRVTTSQQLEHQYSQRIDVAASIDR
jgi:hypothetical protein